MTIRCLCVCACVYTCVHVCVCVCVVFSLPSWSPSPELCCDAHTCPVHHFERPWKQSLFQGMLVLGTSPLTCCPCLRAAQWPWRWGGQTWQVVGVPGGRTWPSFPACSCSQMLARSRGSICMRTAPQPGLVLWNNQSFMLVLPFAKKSGLFL